MTPSVVRFVASVGVFVALVVCLNGLAVANGSVCYHFYCLRECCLTTRSSGQECDQRAARSGRLPLNSVVRVRV